MFFLLSFILDAPFFTPPTMTLGAPVIDALIHLRTTLETDGVHHTRFALVLEPHEILPVHLHAEVVVARVQKPEVTAPFQEHVFEVV